MNVDLRDQHTSPKATRAETAGYDYLNGSKTAFKPLMMSMSVLLVGVVLLTYEWHKAARLQVSKYEEATSLVILHSITELIEDFTLWHMSGVSAAAKALTHYSGLNNSSTDTVLLDRFMVRRCQFREL